MTNNWLERYQNGDRRALSRLLTWAAQGEHLEALRNLTTKTGRKTGQSAAITGAGGVGKSSLIGRLIECFRKQQQSVAVLACDPQSSVTGGALLGDRVRMRQPPEDDGVFIRSLAAVSGQQALAQHLDVMTELLYSFGFDRVLIETVGAGQGDTAAREAADLVILLLQPQIGDELQWEKAGVLEIADVVVIHKCDLAGAEKMKTEVDGLLNLPGSRQVPVLLASAGANQGIGELVRTMTDLWAELLSRTR